MDIKELCERANKRLETDNLVHQNGRVSIEVTPRNVRYYQTIGLLPHPTRVDGRASYDEHHIDDIIAIKRAQANGQSLRTISRQNSGPRQQPSHLAHDELSTANFRQQLFSLNMLTSTTHFSKAFDSPPTFNDNFGWSLQVGKVTISGFGDRPSVQQIEQLNDILNTDDSHNEDDR